MRFLSHYTFARTSFSKQTKTSGYNHLSSAPPRVIRFYKYLLLTLPLVYLFLTLFSPFFSRWRLGMKKKHAEFMHAPWNLCQPWLAIFVLSLPHYPSTSSRLILTPFNIVKHIICLSKTCALTRRGWYSRSCALTDGCVPPSHAQQSLWTLESQISLWWMINPLNPALLTPMMQ